MIYRATKGAPLTHEEVDANFSEAMVASKFVSNLKHTADYGNIIDFTFNNIATFDGINYIDYEAEVGKITIPLPSDVSYFSSLLNGATISSSVAVFTIFDKQGGSFSRQGSFNINHNVVDGVVVPEISGYGQWVFSLYKKNVTDDFLTLMVTVTNDTINNDTRFSTVIALQGVFKPNFQINENIVFTQVV